MFKTLFHCTLIIITLIILDKLIGAFLDQKYIANHCNYNEGGINKYLSEASPDTLIIGTSRAIHMIIADSLGSRTMVMGQQQKNLFYHHAVVSILEQYKKLPKKVLIVNIEVEDLYKEREVRLLQQVSSLAFFYNKNTVVKTYLNRAGPYERIKFLSSIYRHNQNGLLLITNPIQNICPSHGNKGYIPLFPTKMDKIRIENGLKDSKKYSYSEVNREFRSVLGELKKICLKNKIKLILLNGPFYCNFDRMRQSNEKIRKLVKLEKIDYIDFMKYPENDLEGQKLWYDHIHLNHEGAKIYSSLLKYRLKESTSENSSIIY